MRCRVVLTCDLNSVFHDQSGRTQLAEWLNREPGRNIPPCLKRQLGRIKRLRVTAAKAGVARHQINSCMTQQRSRAYWCAVVCRKLKLDRGIERDADLGQRYRSNTDASGSLQLKTNPK